MLGSTVKRPSKINIRNLSIPDQGEERDTTWNDIYPENLEEGMVRSKN